MLISMPLPEDDEMFVNPEHIVSIVPTEHADHCFITLVNDEDGWLVALSAKACADWINRGATVN